MGYSLLSLHVCDAPCMWDPSLLLTNVYCIAFVCDAHGICILAPFVFTLVTLFVTVCSPSLASYLCFSFDSFYSDALFYFTETHNFCLDLLCRCVIPRQ